MGHSLNRTSFRINQNLVIDDKTFNPGYILVSDSKGNASWKNPSNYINNEEPLDHFIGELYGGGIVVAVWREQRETVYEKVLIASVRDYGEPHSVGGSTDFDWRWGAAISTGASYHSFGASNSRAIVSADPSAPATTVCLGYINEDLYGLGIYGDWYLPSTFELNCLANNAGIVNRVIAQYASDKSIRLYDQGVSGSILGASMSLFCGAISGARSVGKAYWTSTELDASNAYSLRMDDLRLIPAAKSTAFNVRPFRLDEKRWNGISWVQDRKKTGKILIVYDQPYLEGGVNFGTLMTNNITTTETGLGNTVFTIVGYSALPPDLSQYDHIWDIGLERNADQSLLVPTGAAAKYTTYLQQGGGLLFWEKTLDLMSEMVIWQVS